VAALVADPDVPGLVRPTSKTVREVRVGAWSFLVLKDGTVFMSHWSGAENENMVTHALFSAEEVEKIAKAFA